MDLPTATMAFLPASARDSPVAGAEEGVGAPGHDGSLAEHAGEVSVAVSGRSVALVLPGAGLDPGSELGPRAQMRWGGEAGHVGADLGEDDAGGGCVRQKGMILCHSEACPRVPCP
jgi:hypothetical protein